MRLNDDFPGQSSLTGTRSSDAEAGNSNGPPIDAFAAVMGFCSVGLGWRISSAILGSWPWIGECLLLIGGLIFVVLAVLYTAKTVRALHDVLAELASPARSALFGCIPISLVLIASAVSPYFPAAARVIWGTGAFIQITLSLYIIGRWIKAPTAVAHASPAWLIPIVGNETAAFAGAQMGLHELSWALFSVGVVCWLALLPLLLNCFIFHIEPPNDAVPSLAVFVSAPAVAALDWRSLVDGGPGFRLFLFVAVFFALLTIRLSGSLFRTRFSVVWWAYTFPSGALAGGLVRYSALVHNPFTVGIAGFGLVAASTILALVSFMSAKSMLEQGSNRFRLNASRSGALQTQPPQVVQNIRLTLPS